MTNSKQKGKRGELELCRVLERVLKGTSWRRSQQFCGVAGDADCIGVDGLHVECKREEGGTKTVYKWLEQAVSDAKNTDVPIVCHRPNGQDWIGIVYLEDLEGLYNVLRGVYDRPNEVAKQG